MCIRDRFDILAKFCDDSFIGRQERRWNALHWLKLEILPKKRFWGVKGGGALTLGTCPSNLVFIITYLTYVRNLRKIGHKLWSLSWTKGLCWHTHRHTLKSNAMNCKNWNDCKNSSSRSSTVYWERALPSVMNHRISWHVSKLHNGDVRKCAL